MKSGVENPGSVAVVAVSILLAVCASPVLATITTVGDIYPVYDSSDPWMPPGTLIIGVTGDANMVISDGSRVVSEWTDIAADIASNASVQVTGAGSTWENSAGLFVGDLGNGTLLISDGGVMTNVGYASIARSESTGQGSVTVTDPGSIWRVDGGIFVGGIGQGELLVSAGGRVESEHADLYDPATVTGPGSLWQNNGYLLVEDWLRIEAGGHVTDANAYVGYGWNMNGAVQVTGAGSVWDNSAELHVGVAGYGAVYIEDGGRVTSRTGVLGTESAGRGDVFITGSDSVWEILPDSSGGLGGDLYVGQSGYGSLWIDNGGRLTSSSGYIGTVSSGNGDFGVVGAGSAWDNSGELHVGVADWGNMYVADGARVTSRTGVLGVESTGTGNVIVDYPFSMWEILPDPNSGLGGDLYVGQSGHGHLQIGNLQTSGVAGGTVVARNAVLAAEPNSEGGVTVIGQDSSLEIEQNLVIGAGGYGHIGAGENGQVSAADTWLALEAGSTAEAIVHGDGTLWSTAGSTVVGNQGHANLVVIDGGHMSTALITSLGEEAGGVGTVLVTGPGSLWETNQSLYIGRSGEGTLTVSDGGVVNVEGVSSSPPPGWITIEPVVESIMAVEAGSVAHAVVTGTGSLWHNQGGLMIAEHGTADVLVADGGRLTSRSLWMSYFPGSVGSLVVSGPNSVCEIGGSMHLGYLGTGTLTISEGALVSNTGSATLGEIGDARGSVTVTDANSIWHIGGSLYVGRQGQGELLVAAGGLVEANDVTIWPTGVVTGDGTLRANEVLNYGTIQPGASIGTMIIDGDLVLEPNGVLEIEIDNSGNSDRILVTGEFNMMGGVIKPIATETIVGQHLYPVIDANNLAGWAVTKFVFGFDTAFLESSYGSGWPDEPNSLLLYVEQVPFDAPEIVQTDNQRSLGGALQQIAEQGGSELTTALQQLQTADEARQAYDQLSGQTIPSLAPATVAGTSRYLGTVSNRLRHSAGAFSNDVGLSAPGLSGPGGMYAGDTLQVDAGRYLFAVGNGSPYLGDKPWGVWGKGFGLYGDRETESGVPGYQYTIYGTSFGVDYRFGEQVRLGVTGGYSEGDIDYAASRDSADVESTHVGLYGSYDTPNWYLDSIFAYGDLDYETRRYVDLLGERLDGDPSGDLYSGYFEAGLSRWHGAKTLIQPLAAFQFAVLDLDSFTETGGASALSFDDERHESYQGSLGVKVTHELFEHADGCRAALELRGRWVHEFGDAKASLDAQFADVPGVTFRVSDEDIARDSALLGAGLDAWFAPHTRLFVDYGVELNADHTVHVVSAGLEYRW